MRFKGTLALLLALVVLSAFVYFYEIKRGGEKREAEKRAARLVAIDRDKIVELSLIYPDKTITGKKDGERGWRIVSPFEATADSAEWDRLAGAFADLEREGVIEEKASDLGRYGLDKPRLRVQARASDGKSAEVHFGSENPTGSYVYAMAAGRPSVLLLPLFSFNTFNKELLYLRERAILKFDEFEVKELELRNKHGRVVLAKRGSDWWLEAPVRLRAAGNEASALLNALSFTRIEHFVDEKPPQNTGLDNPTIEVSLMAGGDNYRRRLVIGGEAPAKNGKKQYYARDDSRREIFLVDQEFYDKLNKSQDQLREKALVRFSRFEIDSLELAGQKARLVLKKENDNWLLSENGRNQIARDKVEELLTALEDAKTERFIDDPKELSIYGLEKPRLTVTLKKGGEKAAHVAFGLSEKPQGKLVYAKSEGEDVVRLVGVALLEKLDLSKKDLIKTGDKK